MTETPQKKIWFSAKRYGWGWAPASVEGWLVLLGYFVLFTAGLVWFMRKTVTLDDALTTDAVVFLIYIALLIITLITICYKKGEKPRWRWGDDEKS